MDNMIIEELRKIRNDIEELKEVLIDKKVLVSKKECNKDYSDQVKFFLEVSGESGSNMVPAGEVYKRYKSWCWEVGKKCLSESKFGIGCSNILVKKRTAKGNFYLNVPVGISEMCKGSIEINKQYGYVQNSVDAFISEISDNKEGVSFSYVKSNVFFEFYKEWCWRYNQKATTVNQFGVITKRHFTKKRSSRGNVYVNLKIKEEYAGRLEELNNEM